MKFQGALFFCIFILLLLGVKSEDGFVSTNGIHLMLNGSPFYANGFNSYWLMYMASDLSTRNKVTSAFQEAQEHGLNIARTWAFSDGGDRPLQYSPGSYNEQMFQGLDFVISEAKNHGIKLILSLVNNYKEYGGKKQYVNWARNQGQSLSSDDDFFTNSVVQGYYKNHVQTVITRRNTITGVVYKDDPTIMAWELMNEPRCESDTSGRTVQAWITEMAAHVKSIDKIHLLEAGLEGFYGQEKEKLNPSPNLKIGTDFISNNQIPGIDFTTVHCYPDQWLPQGSTEEQQIAFLTQWLQNHIQDAQNVLNKPVLFGEFGKTSEFGIDKRDRLYSTVYSAILTSAQGGGAAVGGLFWQLFVEGMDSFGDGLQVILSENSSTVGIITGETAKLNHIKNMYVKLMRRIHRKHG